jgi:ATP-dependent Clp protease ATP-binding subunit ClpA
MRANQFTQSAQSALRLAQSTAGELGHSYVGSEHILIGILSSEESIARRCLQEQPKPHHSCYQAPDVLFALCWKNLYPL